METSSIALTNGLTFLAIATGIIFIVVGSFLVKLLIDLSKLTKNLDETASIVKVEIKPALQELNSTLKSINSIAQNADKKVDSIANVFESLFGAGTLAFQKAKVFSGGLVKGLTKGLVTVIKLFIKK